jgi:hypothetical protein
MTKDEALKLALKALRFARDDGYENEVSQQAITAIKQALAAPVQPVQEPVAWMQSDEVHISLWKDDYHTIPLYTTPPTAQPEPDGWAISYDGKTPYAIWLEGDGPLLNLEVKRQGGTCCKLPLYTTPPAAAVQEGRDWSLLEATQESLREHMAEIKRLKEANPAVPDAIGPNEDELPAYAAGWNDCRAAMLEMMK